MRALLRYVTALAGIVLCLLSAIPLLLVLLHIQEYANPIPMAVLILANVVCVAYTISSLLTWGIDNNRGDRRG